MFGWREWLWKDPAFGNKILRHAIQAELSVSCNKIFETASPLISDSLIPQIAIPLFIMCTAKFSERPTKFFATPKMN